MQFLTANALFAEAMATCTDHTTKTTTICGQNVELLLRSNHPVYMSILTTVPRNGRCSLFSAPSTARAPLRVITNRQTVQTGVTKPATSRRLTSSHKQCGRSAAHSGFQSLEGRSDLVNGRGGGARLGALNTGMCRLVTWRGGCQARSQNGHVKAWKFVSGRSTRIFQT